MAVVVEIALFCFSSVKGNFIKFIADEQGIRDFSDDTFGPEYAEEFLFKIAFKYKWVF